MHVDTHHDEPPQVPPRGSTSMLVILWRSPQGRLSLSRQYETREEAAAARIEPPEDCEFVAMFTIDEDGGEQVIDS